MSAIVYLPILFFSIILHEYAHGYIACRNGDDTAYILGRLTFNPLKHVDLVGSIIVPLFCITSGLPLFGWAKPVPVNPYNLNNIRNDMAKVAFAGPAANLVLVVISVFALKLVVMLAPNFTILMQVFVYSIMINLLLALFNLMPIPPLDGSKILARFLPTNAANKYMRFEKYGMLLVVILILIGVFEKILLPVFYIIFNLILSFVGGSFNGL
ncbi:MAG: site-2 protease family protein [Elusimicrobiaceae bacterium]|nr:site-2 protease family protein [Elusimicrobiaceae bacterium]